MKRYVCIHGHFYQPPRENPWLETIELQDSAAPYHDWNKRITAECYAPNARSRVLDDQNRITQIVNNYARISFNFGPTLLAWMEESSPRVYEAIQEADKESRDRFSGHGSALAQAYNHMILPLATTRDKTTQILWGIRDFEYRFNRQPKGMWLPETAVDLESLDIMADSGIDFTILAPHQARRVRPLGADEWIDVNEGDMVTTMPYRLNLPSGRHITLFFYHGVVSRAVAFERLLFNGESFAHRLLSGFHDENNERPAQMVHIATDGESYGHHHRFGEMALSFALHFIEAKDLATQTNYGEFLEKYPPTFEAEIHENSSWSCAHGVERWRSDCGCHTGAHPSWNQKWREPLREALDQVRDTMAPSFEQAGGKILRDPWEARNDYVQVILDRSEERIDVFLKRHAIQPLDREQRTRVLKLMELQRHAMLMATSCGWFFDDLSGIETIQIMQYAFRAVQLYREVFGQDLEPLFLRDLALATSNDPDVGNGAQIYEKSVRTAMVDLQKAAVTYAMDSLFKDSLNEIRVSGHTFEEQDHQQFDAGNARLTFGRVTARSKITEDFGPFYFGLLHLGDHNLTCGIREFQDEADYDALIYSVAEAFRKADIPETLRRLDSHFGSSIYSLKSLYRDAQRSIMKRILRSTEEDIEATYRNLYEKYMPLLLFLKDSESIPPQTLFTAAELVLYADLVQALDMEEPDPDQIEEIMGRADELGIYFDEGPLEFQFRKSLERMGLDLESAPDDLKRLKNMNAALGVLKTLKFGVNLWTIQNVCYDMLQSRYPELKKKAAKGDHVAREWIDQFVTLGDHLDVFIP